MCVSTCRIPRPAPRGHPDRRDADLHHHEEPTPMNTTMKLHACHTPPVKCKGDIHPPNHALATCGKGGAERIGACASPPWPVEWAGPASSVDCFTTSSTGRPTPLSATRVPASP